MIKDKPMLGFVLTAFFILKLKVSSFRKSILLIIYKSFKKTVAAQRLFGKNGRAPTIFMLGGVAKWFKKFGKLRFWNIQFTRYTGSGSPVNRGRDAAVYTATASLS